MGGDSYICIRTYVCQNPSETQQDEQNKRFRAIVKKDTDKRYKASHSATIRSSGNHAVAPFQFRASVTAFRRSFMLF